LSDGILQLSPKQQGERDALTWMLGPQPQLHHGRLLERNMESERMAYARGERGARAGCDGHQPLGRVVARAGKGEAACSEKTCTSAQKEWFRPTGPDKTQGPGGFSWCVGLPPTDPPEWGRYFFFEITPATY